MMKLVFGILLALCLIEISLRDMRTYEISDKAVLLLFLGGLAYSVANSFFSLLSPIVSGAAMLIVYLASRGGMGLGDVKLAAAAGAWFTLPEIALFEIIAFWLGALAAIYLIAFKKCGRKSMLPFAPFLSAAIMATFLFGDRLLELYGELLL